MQSEMELRPSADKINEMIAHIDDAFKQQMGENLVGLRVSVGQVLQSVQQRATKDDVFKIIMLGAVHTYIACAYYMCLYLCV